MAKEFFKNLPDKTTPLTASRINGLLNGKESMGSIVVEDIECKNIFNVPLIQGAYIYSSGDYMTSDNYVTFGELQKVNPGETYIISAKSSKALTYDGVIFYNNGLFVGDAREQSFTVPSNANQIRYNIRIEVGATPSEIYDVQLEKGTTITPYTPHKEFSNKQIYSTEEQVIGKWIDGKPLYRKMVDTGTMPSNSGKYFEHGISNVEHIHVNLGETMWIGNPESFTGKTTVFSPIFSDDAGAYIRQLAANSSSIQIGTSNVNANYFKLLVCVEYTKTND